MRIAIAKYVHAGERTSKKRGSMSTTEKIADVSEALEALLTRDVAPNLPPEARVVPDVFRERRLFAKQIAEALERAETMLHALFDFYAASMDDHSKLGKAFTKSRSRSTQMPLAGSARMRSSTTARQWNNASMPPLTETAICRASSMAFLSMGS